MADKSIPPPRRARGTGGSFEVNPSGAIIPRLRELPRTKQELELYFSKIFIDHYSDQLDNFVPFKDLRQNPENDVDFLALSAQGPKSVEAVEFAPLNKLRANFYNVPSNTFGAGEIADMCMDTIKGKINKRQGSDILLIYSTHDEFTISGIIEELMRRFLSQLQPPFERIYYAQALGTRPGEGRGVRLYPSMGVDAFPGIPTARLYRGRATNFNPATATIIGGNIILPRIDNKEKKE